MKLRIEIDDADAQLIEMILTRTRDCDHGSHGPLTMKRLAEMLLADVALAVRRPGSWEGANMRQVLHAHGHEVWRRPIDTAR